MQQVVDIVLIGRDLQEAHDKLAHKADGTFRAWIQAEFGMSKNTADRFMAVAETFGGRMSQIGTFTPSVLYELAAPKNADVREAVVQQIEAGEVKPSVKEVQATPEPPGA